MAEYIKKKWDLNTGREKINEVLTDNENTASEAKTTANIANNKSDQAVNTANEAKQQSDSTQHQLDTVIIESGTSDAETIQARTNERGTQFNILKDRLDNLDIEFEQRGVNVKWFGASGSDQSTTGSIDAGNNELTVTDAIDFEVGQGILIEGAGPGGVAEVAELQITSAPTTAGQVVVTLDGIATNVDVDPAVEDTAISVADKIRNISFTGWTTGGTAGTDTVTLTCDTVGEKQNATYNDSGTGATGTMTTTTEGEHGSNLVTSITAINETVFILVDNASADVSNAKVSHNDAEVIKTISQSGYKLFFPDGNYVIGNHLLIEGVNDLSWEFSKNARLKDGFNVDAQLSNGNPTKIPNGTKFYNCKNLRFVDVKYYNSRKYHGELLEEESNKRIPTFDFESCDNVVFDHLVFDGYSGVYVPGSIDEYGALHHMKGSFMRMHKCDNVRFSDCELTTNSGRGEIYSLYECDKVIFERPLHIKEGTDHTFWSLAKFIQCNQVLIRDIENISSTSTGSMFDVSGSDYIVDNINCDYPNGIYIDATLEWGMYSGDTNNVHLMNLTARNSSTIARVEHSSVLSDEENEQVSNNLSINNIRATNCYGENLAYFMRTRNMETVNVSDCVVKNCERLNYEERTKRTAYKLSDQTFEKIKINSASDFRIEVFGNTKVVNSDIDVEGNNLILTDRYAQENNIELCESVSEMKFSNVKFDNCVIVIRTNVIFSNCEFYNCRFVTDSFIGNNPNVYFVSSNGTVIISSLSNSSAVFNFAGGGENVIFNNTRFVGEFESGGVSIFNDTSQVNEIEFINSSFNILRYNAGEIGNQEFQPFIVLNNNSQTEVVAQNSWFGNRMVRFEGDDDSVTTRNNRVIIQGCVFGGVNPFRTFNLNAIKGNVYMMVNNSTFSISSLGEFSQDMSDSGNVFVENHNAFNMQ